MGAQVLSRLSARGFGLDLIAGLGGFIIDELRRHLIRWRDEQSALIFRSKLANGTIQFRLRGDAGDWIMPDTDWTTADETARQLVGTTGQPLQRSLFLPVYAADLNAEEQKVALYLDDESAIRWWHRNGTTRDSYAVRGWRRGNVFPDFIFAALRDGFDQRIVAVESKGDQLAGNLDTEYKRSLLSTLSAAYTQPATGDPLPRGRVDFEAAVVLFSEVRARLPVLIRGT